MKKLDKNILYTFDYELFLGKKSGSVHQCMIVPTERLIHLLSKYNAKGIFFVDTTYLVRLKALKNYKTLLDFEAIKVQLQRLVEKGHYVFPHIHPHWLDATYDESTNQWSLLNTVKYRFHNLTTEERNSVFESSVNMLKEIIYPIRNNYSIDGYRAGGWSIQPFSDFESYFKKYSIKYEFSVLKGFNSFTTAQYYDFTNGPSDDIYKFQDNVLKKSKNGLFTELTISSIGIGVFGKFFNKIWEKYLWKTGNRSLGDGIGVISQKITMTKEKNPIDSSDKREMISLELLNFAKLPLYLKYLKRNKYMQFISHPKMLSNHNFKSMELFMKRANDEYVVETDFKNMI